MNTLLNQLNTDSKVNNNGEENGLEELAPSEPPTNAHSPEDFLPLTQNNSHLPPKQENCISTEQIQMLPTAHPFPFQTTNIPSRTSSQDEDWSKLLDVLPQLSEF